MPAHLTETHMTQLRDLPAAFLPSVEFLLRECGPDQAAAPEEVEAIARVALRLDAWIRELVPEGIRTCGEASCELPATDMSSRGSLCPFHASALPEGDAG
jgi:hypothetical protein